MVGQVDAPLGALVVHWAGNVALGTLVRPVLAVLDPVAQLKD